MCSRPHGTTTRSTPAPRCCSARSWLPFARPGAYRERWNRETANPAIALGAALLVSGPSSTAASPCTGRKRARRHRPRNRMADLSQVHTNAPKKEAVRGARAFGTAGRSAVDHVVTGDRQATGGRVGVSRSSPRPAARQRSCLVTANGDGPQIAGDQYSGRWARMTSASCCSSSAMSSVRSSAVMMPTSWSPSLTGRRRTPCSAIRSVAS